MAVWNEEALLPDALESLNAAGVQMHNVLVFDGAWKGFGQKPGGRSPHSTDRTEAVVFGAGAYWLPSPPSGWESQEEKRNAMFSYAYQDYDVAFVMDADERLEGRFPDRLLDGHANVMVKCVGENDLPGIRGEWPRGDYYADWKPELRLFRLSSELHCKWPGGYWDADGKIEPYADYAGTPALPVLDGVRFTHHGADRSPDRIEQKIAYYHAEHPERAQRQRAQWLADQSLDELVALYRRARRDWHRARVQKDTVAVLAASGQLAELDVLIYERRNPR